MKSMSASVTRGLSTGSRLKCADNSGATELEIIAVKGASGEAQKLADTLKAVNGVKHGTLSMSSTGKGIA